MKRFTVYITAYLMVCVLGVCEQVPPRKAAPQQAAAALKQISGIVRCARNGQGNVTSARLLRKEKGQSSKILHISLASGVGADMAKAMEGKLVTVQCRVVRRKNLYWISVVEYKQLEAAPDDPAVGTMNPKPTEP